MSGMGGERDSELVLEEIERLIRGNGDSVLKTHINTCRVDAMVESVEFDGVVYRVSLIEVGDGVGDVEVEAVFDTDVFVSMGEVSCVLCDVFEVAFPDSEWDSDTNEKESTVYMSYQSGDVGEWEETINRIVRWLVTA